MKKNKKIELIERKLDALLRLVDIINNLEPNEIRQMLRDNPELFKYLLQTEVEE